MKKVTGTATIIFLLIFVLFFKYAIWGVLVGAIIAIILFTCKKISERNSKPDKSINNVSAGLNYTPLTQKEINAKYPILPKIEEPRPMPEPPISNPILNHTPSTKTEIKEKEPAMNNLITKRGIVSTQRVMFDNDVVKQTSNRYFAFDVETTGLNAYSERIIEIGAVLFENGKSIKTFGSLVNPKIRIPYAATAVNHITNEMITNAPAEEIVYPELVQFLGDALEERTIICAHNASFDMKFLSETLERLGYDAKISYVDTLSISRYMLPNLDNHKQQTVANHLGIINQNAHRAVSDAEVCGQILSHFIDLKLAKIQEAEKIEAEKAENRRIKEEEKRIRKEAAQKAKEEREHLKQLKEEEKQKKLIEKQIAASLPKKPIGRSIIQMDDNFNVIKQYDSVAEASRETNINTKSIRDAAKGVQKHAGGFVWKYADEMEEL